MRAEQLSEAGSAAASGLTEAEARRLLKQRGPSRPPQTSRSYASIVRGNVFTVFNLIIAVFGALTLAFGDWRDSLFLGILVVNSGIGIVQEVRAKRALDRLALLVAPSAHAVRDGHVRDIAVAEVVVGDLLQATSGDQVVADGEVTRSDGLLVDESILTGESRSVARAPGEELRSGSFVVEGGGRFTVTAVGEGSYAERVVGAAREFRQRRSPLQLAINRLLYILVAFVVVLGGLLGFSLWHRQASINDAVSTSTAGVVTMIPEGLIALVSLTYAVASVRMARRGVLAQQLNAIESLASVTMICLDKTGTLTESSLHVVDVIPAAGVEREQADSLLARYAASTPNRNLTLAAIARDRPGDGVEPEAQVPFSSGRRWGGLRLEGTSYVLGAPELFDLGPLAEIARDRQDDGRRVLAFASSPGDLPDEVADGELPPPGTVICLVVLGEELRAETRETIAFLRSQGIGLKVLSGDNPATVAAVARDAGIPVDRVAEGSEVPEDAAALRAFVEATSVVGRISPEGKRRVVLELHRAGHHVAMVGDGVNDAPALKAADLAIAQGPGAQIAKSVADLVLVRGDFAAVPALVDAGRQALRNLQRVARLYVTKSALAAFLILLIGITSTAYPLLPRHFTIAGALTIGIPSFFLALAPSTGAWTTAGFARETGRFAVPAGFIIGVGLLSAYLFSLHDLDLPVESARTVATSVLVIAGLYLIMVLEAGGWRRDAIVGLLCIALGSIYVLALAFPPTRSFFELAPVSWKLAAASLGGAAVSIVFLYLAGFTIGRPARSS